MFWNDIIFMEKNFMIAKKNGYQNWIYFATTTKKSAVVTCISSVSFPILLVQFDKKKYRKEKTKEKTNKTS